MITRRNFLGLSAAATVALVSGCTGGAEDGDAGGGDFSGDVSGTVTMLTNRTDLVSTVLPGYAKKFEAKYPGTTVKFQGVTNYDGDVTTQLSGGDYGDVLLIPNGVPVGELGQFFEPLGALDDLREKYRFTDERAFDGQVYGLSLGGIAKGVVVNKRIWAQAGVTAPPPTPEAFLAGLRAIKQKTAAIPYYTNYKDGWPLSEFNNHRAILNDPAIFEEFPTDRAPWQQGKVQYVTDGLLFDIVHGGLSEKDPVTTNWESSKTMLAAGQVATMLLGSWAVPQMQAAAKTAGTDPADIALWPFPFRTGGKFHAEITADYSAAVSRNSKNKATAKALLDWMVDESGFAADQQAIPPALAQQMPAVIEDFQNTGVVLLDLPAATKNAGKEDEIIKEAEIDLTGNIYRQKLVDIARGAADGSRQSSFDDLNRRWGAAQAKVMK
ncbi:ABC transporter substrate-binding protein [Cryptosporangium arvum]|uniref:ABC transporter substrate-binding protein n=1 Tax=Cryptosporangium arvum TaxID=80871 RepID=UPI0004AD7618|nr:ABC transporter substrate-binding protein [Cryptosporangium arvum]